MGKSKSTYFITTKPLEEQNFFDWKKKQTFIENWKVEPIDKEIFKDDAMYISLLKTCLKSKKELEKYKFNKRNK